MSDFIHDSWGYFISAIALGGIAWCVWLLYSQRRWLKTRPAAGTPVESTGHVWDGDLTELNNPVPRWWTWMYLLLCAFALGYLALMPGLGSYPGLLNFTSADAITREQAAQAQAVQPVYARYAAMTPEQIARDPKAQEIGVRLFLNTCAQCHGSDAKGAPNFPNLTDKDWLGEGTPEYIAKTIEQGRHGVMPAWKGVIDPKNAAEIAAYVRSLSGLAADPVQVVFGKAGYENYCAACHGIDGKGNRALGAPNLSDGIWLNSTSQDVIVRTILEGRDNRMPAFGQVLTPDQIRVLSAWVWGLSNTAPR
jgi:cytochrome c oxidase cbb3-type subunit III